MSLHGNILFRLTGPRGELKDLRAVRNIVTNVGRGLLISRLRGGGGMQAVPSYIAIGTGTTAAAAADTALQTEVARAQGTLTQPDAYTDRAVYTFPAGTGTGAITECGRLNAAAVGTLFCRQVFAAINKLAGDALEVIYDIGYPAQVSFSDAFAGTNGQPLAAPWELPAGLADPFQYLNGTAIEDPGGDGSTAVVSTVSFRDGYAQATLQGTAASLQRMLLRWINVTAHYAAWVQNDVVHLSRGSTELTSAAITYSAGKILRLEAAGAAIVVKWDGATIINHTDTSPLLEAGKPGIRGGQSLGAIFDDFEAASL